MDRIRKASTDRDWATARRLFQAYAASLRIDLEFQGFTQELATLPGGYAAPHGAVFLATDIDSGQDVGCIGLRRFADLTGELKRLYVDPGCRGKGFGRKLIGAAVAEARRLGYTSLVLDTLASMHPAIALYESSGFRRTAPYYPNPLPDVVYFRAELCGSPH